MTLREVFENKKQILNIYFTAGYPRLNDTIPILKSLQDAGVDLVELGVPYSDPLADGLTIQESSKIALQNGMKLELLLEQLKHSNKHIKIPVLLMGYFNQFLQFGMGKLLNQINETPVQAMIIPDMPSEYFETHYKEMFQEAGVSISFLVTPETPENRIRDVDRLSNAFVYLVARSGITGKTGNINDSQLQYFERIKNMSLKSNTLIGFGIHDHQSYIQACQYADGAIIGSEFIRFIGRNSIESIPDFIQSIRNG